MGMTESEFKRLRDVLAETRAKRIERDKGKPPRTPKPVKKGRPRFARSPAAERTHGGVTYASKCEMEFAKHLESDRLMFKIPTWWCRQPIFDLAGAIYRPDFLVVHGREIQTAHGDRVQQEIVTVYEVKPKLHGSFRAEALRTFKRNQKQMKALHGIDVVLVEM